MAIFIVFQVNLNSCWKKFEIFWCPRWIYDECKRKGQENRICAFVSKGLRKPHQIRFFWLPKTLSPHPIDSTNLPWNVWYRRIQKRLLRWIMNLNSMIIQYFGSTFPIILWLMRDLIDLYLFFGKMAPTTPSHHSKLGSIEWKFIINYPHGYKFNFVISFLKRRTSWL